MGLCGSKPSKGVDGVSSDSLTDVGTGGSGERADGSYPIEVLQTSNPEGVNKKEKELALSDEKFKELMGTDKEGWKKVPAWKKKNLRIQHRLSMV